MAPSVELQEPRLCATGASHCRLPLPARWPAADKVGPCRRTPPRPQIWMTSVFTWPAEARGWHDAARLRRGFRQEMHQEPGGFCVYPLKFAHFATRLTPVAAAPAAALRRSSLPHKTCRPPIPSPDGKVIAVNFPDPNRETKAAQLFGPAGQPAGPARLSRSV